MWWMVDHQHAAAAGRLEQQQAQQRPALEVEGRAAPRRPAKASIALSWRAGRAAPPGRRAAAAPAAPGRCAAAVRPPRSGAAGRAGPKVVRRASCRRTTALAAAASADRVECAGRRDRRRQVVGGGAGSQAVEEPQPRWAKDSGAVAPRPATGGDRRQDRGAAGQARRQLRRQPRRGGRAEQRRHRQLDGERLAQAGDGLEGGGASGRRARRSRRRAPSRGNPSTSPRTGHQLLERAGRRPPGRRRGLGRGGPCRPAPGGRACRWR